MALDLDLAGHGMKLFDLNGFVKVVFELLDLELLSQILLASEQVNCIRQL